jgi:hypothetical protein
LRIGARSGVASDFFAADSYHFARETIRVLIYGGNSMTRKRCWRLALLLTLALAVSVAKGQQPAPGSPYQPANGDRNVVKAAEPVQIQLKLILAEMDWALGDKEGVEAALEHPLWHQFCRSKCDSEQVRQMLSRRRSQGRARILAEPCLITLAGRKGSFQAGSPGEALLLEFTPTLTANGSVHVDVRGTTQRLDGITRNHLDAGLIAPLGKSLVFGFAAPMGSRAKAKGSSSLLLVVTPEVAGQFGSVPTGIQPAVAQTPTILQPASLPRMPPALACPAQNTAPVVSPVPPVLYLHISQDKQSDALQVHCGGQTLVCQNITLKLGRLGNVQIAAGSQGMEIKGQDWHATANEISQMSEGQSLLLLGKVRLTAKRAGLSEQMKLDRATLDPATGRMEFQTGVDLSAPAPVTSYSQGQDNVSRY